MTNKSSRRTVLKAGIATAAGLAAPISMATKPSGSDADLESVEKGLAKPIAAEIRQAAKEAIKAVQGTSEGRLKHKLPENTEPSFSFSVRSAKSRGWADAG